MYANDVIVKFASAFESEWEVLKMPHIKDSDMEELSRQVLRKVDGMTDKEFAENSLEAVEE